MVHPSWSQLKNSSRRRNTVSLKSHGTLNFINKNIYGLWNNYSLHILYWMNTESGKNLVQVQRRAGLYTNANTAICWSSATFLPLPSGYSFNQMLNRPCDNSRQVWGQEQMKVHRCKIHHWDFWKAPTMLETHPYRLTWFLHCWFAYLKFEESPEESCFCHASLTPWRWQTNISFWKGQKYMEIFLDLEYSGHKKCYYFSLDLRKPM